MRRLARDFLNDLLVYKKVYIKRITNDRYWRTVAELFKMILIFKKFLLKKDMGRSMKDMHINGDGLYKCFCLD